MSNYIRRFVPGGTFFFTARLQDPASDLLVRKIDLLRDATRLCQKRWPFIIDAAVVLPNAVHMIWTLPPDDAAYSIRWRMIKTTFSRHVPPATDRTTTQLRRGEKGIWQRRFWEHMIRDQADFQFHMHVIAAAPVHAGLVRAPGGWRFSTVQRRKVGLDPPTARTTGRVPLGQGPATAATAN
ncbi:transposase [Yoonia sp.]|jgi:putative transposase|uniref:REP-associated tyrosine transposase n=1 Tax=Yoonia sp. TaxID=2212373 RepID=UPI0025DC085B|nr:transposase [Yoonia sp.]